MYQGGPQGGFDPRYPSGAFGKILTTLKHPYILFVFKGTNKSK